jgi:hypothetical protein
MHLFCHALHLMLCVLSWKGAVLRIKAAIKARTLLHRGFALFQDSRRCVEGAIISTCWLRVLNSASVCPSNIAPFVTNARLTALIKVCS